MVAQYKKILVTNLLHPEVGVVMNRTVLHYTQRYTHLAVVLRSDKFMLNTKTLAVMPV